VNVEPVCDVRAELGEGPCWSVRDGAVWWVDIPAGRVHRTVATGETVSVACAPPVSSVHVRAAGGMLVTGRASVVELGVREVATLAVPAGLRLNDAKTDPAGRLWLGTMDPEGKARCALYRIGTDGEPHRVLTRVTVSNGLGWSPDGTRLYYVDSPTQRIDAFAFDSDSGALGDRRTFAVVAPAAGRPDGLAVDDGGGVWVALFGGGALRRYDARGRLDAVITVPAAHPTSCAFGGADLGELYVTTARRPLTAGERAANPLAGALLRLRPGVRGQPVAACRL
jgi:sugar lactone lactonase YvrE